MTDAAGGLTVGVGSGPGVQARDLPLDAHLHTDLSPDADVPLDLYAQLAVEQGIAELAITDHLDFDPRAPAYAYADFATRERTVRQAAERWGDRVAIRFGVEITYQLAYESEIREHLAHHAYDYTVGSVHAMKESPYLPSRVAGFVAGRPLAAVVAPYFDEVLAAVRSGLFDTLGHLDIVKRWLHPHVDPETLSAAPELFEPILAALVETGMTLEVNTSGLRHAPAETYPAAWAVERYRELGGRHVTVGSDSHAVAAFAFGLEEGYAIAARAGLEEVRMRRGHERAALRLPVMPGTALAGGRFVMSFDEIALERLVEQAKAGEPEAFGRIFDLYHESVYRYIASRVRRPVDAEDLTQTVFVKALEALPRYESRGVPFGGWLFRLARNVVIDHVRTRRDHADLDSIAERIGEEDGPEAVAAARQEMDAIAAALEALTAEQRDAIALRFFAGLSAREAAEAMGKQEGTVRGLQFRAIAALRRQLGLEERTDEPGEPRESGTHTG